MVSTDFPHSPQSFIATLFDKVCDVREWLCASAIPVKQGESSIVELRLVN
jgi:hypothetical protein